MDSPATLTRRFIGVLVLVALVPVVLMILAFGVLECDGFVVLREVDPWWTENAP